MFKIKPTTLLVALASLSIDAQAQPVKLFGIDKIAKLSSYAYGEYIIQAGVFKNEANARRLAEKLNFKYRYPINIIQSSNDRYIVTVGPIRAGNPQIHQPVHKPHPTQPITRKPVKRAETTNPGIQNTTSAPAISFKPENPKPPVEVGYSITSEWVPRATTEGLFGGNEQAGGFIDTMVPVWGMPDKLLYADGSVLLGNNNRQAYSIGMGYRGIYEGTSNSGIYGVFGFADWYQSQYKKQVWIANPGLEWLTSNYELRAQGYFTLSNRSQNLIRALASQLTPRYLEDSGRSNEYSYSNGHTIYDARIYLTQEFGNGGEIEGGIHFPWLRGGWLRVGGYGFQYKNAKSIQGAQANLQFFLNKNSSIIFQDNYDNQNKNRFSVGFQINFGGPDISHPEILKNRMEEPIIRHNARQSYGEAMPTRLSYKLNYDLTQEEANNSTFGGIVINGGGNSFTIPSITIPVSIIIIPPNINIPAVDNGDPAPGDTTTYHGSAPGPVIIYNNVWFFSSSASTPSTISYANCTASSPCGTPTQSTLDQINNLAPGTRTFLVFGSGNYTLRNQPTFAAESRYLNFYKTQIVWGRSKDYKNAVIGDNRPLLNGSLYWGHDGMGVKATGTVVNIRVNNSSQAISNAISGYGADAIIGLGATGNMYVYGSDVFLTSNSSTMDAIGINSSQYTVMYNTSVTVNAYNNSALPRTNIGVRANNIISAFDTIRVTSNNSDGVNSQGLVATNVIVSSDIINTKAEARNAPSNSTNILATNAIVLHSSLYSSALNNSANAEQTNITATGDVIVNNSILISSNTSNLGNTTSYNIKGANYAVVNNSTLENLAYSTSGSTTAIAISSAYAGVENSTIAAEGKSLSFDPNAQSIAKGVYTTENSYIDGSTITARSGAQGHTTSIGVESEKATHVTNSTLNIFTYYTSRNEKTSTTYGIKGASGTVYSTTIVISNNSGAHTLKTSKCVGVSSTDASCG